MTEWQTGRVVQCKGILRLNRVEIGIFQNRLGPGPGFLGRLEKQDQAALCGALPGQEAGQPHQDRHMPIVAAKVPDPVDEGAMGGRASLKDRQGVEFTAEKDGGAIFGTIEDRRHTMPAKIGDHVIGRERREFLNDALGGLRLVTRHLGVTVQIVAQGDQVNDIGIGEGHMPFVAR